MTAALASPLRLLVALLCSSLLLAASAAPNLDGARSKLTATFRQSGVSVDTDFTRFSGRIAYDPARVEAATAALDVATGSLDFGDESYNEEVRKKAWLDAVTYPQATFRSSAIKATGPGRFIATGILAMKGKVQTIHVPISVQATPDGPAFDGSFSLSRKAWAIGDPVWDDVLEDVVVVRFHLVSTGR